MTTDIREYIKSNTLYLDGGMGTLLQAEGLVPGELPERWSVSHPERIKAVHRAYFDAGSNVVNTNTFGANILKFSEDELELIVKSSIRLAREAADECKLEGERWVALDIGPTGRMLKPYGDLDFEDAVKVFSRTVELGVKYGADLIFIETMNDSYETKAALLAAKENSSLPVFVSNAYGEDAKLMTGADAVAMVAMLEGMGADAIGVNCSLGPKALRPVIEKYLEYSSLPIILKPNAGLPRAVDGKTVYDVDPYGFSGEICDMIKLGVRAVGGCCGTTPDYIRELVLASSKIEPREIIKKEHTLVSSYTHAVIFGDEPILIGERINPTGKKLFKEALRNNDMDYILREGIAQQEKGVHILDVNVGLPEIDEVQMLRSAVCELQAIIDLPLQIDTSSAEAMEKALRVYNGKPMINSVNGKSESMEKIFPLAKKYGGLIVALTLDENGIPNDAEGRIRIAKKILAEAQKWGIDKKDIIFDPLALTVSADNNAAKETLRAIREIKYGLSVHTSLGVSNVSFGLPQRDVINGVFFTMALANGLSAAIMNPYSAEMMKSYFAYRALAGQDENCSEFMSFSQTVETVSTQKVSSPVTQTDSGTHSELYRSIVKGIRERAASLTSDILKSTDPLKIIQNDIIPALNEVGEGFEKKTVYLPSLLMSAEAAKAAFEVIKASMPKDDGATSRCSVVLATVSGDIHDIGKNIVKLLLENYGFSVTDLGHDVPADRILQEVISTRSPLLGLSALMTTTVPAMEETIKLVRKSAPWCKIMVGGAVLTREYADTIGADYYGKDAMEAVRYAETVDAAIRKK